MEIFFLSLLEGSLLPDPSEPAAGPAFCPGVSSAEPAELRACSSPRLQPRCPASPRQLPGSRPGPHDPYFGVQQFRMLVLFLSIVTSGSTLPKLSSFRQLLLFLTIWRLSTTDRERPAGLFCQSSPK